MLFSPLSTVFQLYRGSQLNWWRKLDYRKKTTLLYRVHLIMTRIGTQKVAGDRNLFHL